MSMSRTLAPHLPYLRRYARALTGSQASGDAYVRAALTALLAGKQELATKLPPKVALYQLFHAIWSSSSDELDDEDGPGVNEQTPEGRLHLLAANSRAALLLTAVEGFSLAEAGQI